MNWPLPIRLILVPLSWVYGLMVRSKTFLYTNGILSRKRLDGSVISVGNLTVGGTGKTPMVLWLAEKFVAEGKRVAILSRGYRGSGQDSDEVNLLKRRLGNRVRFGVGANRYEQGRKLEQAEPVDIFLLDDGFQHLKLAHDVDIVMLDGSKRLKGEWLLPAGRLREPISACRRSDLLVVTRKFERPPIDAHDSHEHRLFYAQTRLLGLRKLGESGEPAYRSEIGPGPFFAFCGIGSPDGFRKDLERWQLPVAGRCEFRDHHHYNGSDVARLEVAARRAGAQALITTEKDEENLRGLNFAMPVYVAVIDLTFGSESDLVPALERILSERRGKPQ